jgi:hypothetical protein
MVRVWSIWIAAAIALALAALSTHAQIRPQVAPTNIQIETSPKADVFLDGKLAGKTDAAGRLMIANPSAGAHRIRVELAHKKPYERVVTVVTGNSLTVRADLADETSHLEILTLPDAEVRLDGKPAGKADITGRLLIRDLRPALHRVVVTHGGYNLTEITVDLPPNIVTSLNIALRLIATVAKATAGTPPDYAPVRRLIAPSTPGQTEVALRADPPQLVCWQLGDNHAYVFDPSTGRQIRVIHLKEAQSILAVSPDQHWIAAFGPDVNHHDMVSLVNIETDSIVRSFASPIKTRYYSAFSADAKLLALAGESGPIHSGILWSVDDGNVLKHWEMDILPMALAPHRRLLAAAGYDGVFLCGPRQRRAETGGPSCGGLA